MTILPKDAVARVWRGSATVDQADAYHRHVTETVFPEIARLAGHRGAFLLRRPTAAGAEFLVVTLWDSIDAVKAFAGTQPDVAVVEPAAQAILSEFDDFVQHYTVVHST